MKKILIYIIPVFAIFCGCEEIMDQDFTGNNSDRLIVDGLISTDTTAHKIILSRSGDFFVKEPQNMETGALVTITDGTSIYNLSEIGPGIYATDNDVFGEIGKTYTLNIQTSNNETHTASETIVGLPEIDSITQSVLNENPHMGNYYQIYYNGPEPEGLGDFYMWNLYINDSLDSDTIFEKVFTGDENVDGNYIQDFALFYLPEEDIHFDSVKITVEMISISESYYDFLYAINLETVWKGSPWDGPPANVPSNVSNNALGHFRAADIKRKSFYLHKTYPVIK